ncbi:MAG TPA: DcrB-related protein [Pyrinomonadaceae bacterium]|nr:DcrB-related protein [Pyrinomonadaceae bacterium]
MKFTANEWKSVLPGGWADRSMITLVGATGASGIAANIVVTREELDGQTGVEDYAESQKQAMAEEIERLEILDERATTLNGAPAFQRLQRFQIEDLIVQQAQTFVLDKNVVFVITGTASVEDLDAIIDAVRAFAENFRLLNDKI